MFLIPLALFLLFLGVVGYTILTTVVKSPRLSSWLTPDYSPSLMPVTNWIVGLVILGYNIFLYNANARYIPTVGLFGMNMVMAVVWLLMIPVKKRTVGFWLLWSINILASMALLWRANRFIQTLDVSTLSFTSALLYALYVFDQTYGQLLWWLKNSLRLLGKSMGIVLRIRRPSGDVVKPRSTLVHWLITGAITLCLSLVFIGLFTAADPVFAKLTTHLVDQIVPRSIISLVLALVCVWALAVRMKSDPDNQFHLTKVDYSYVFVPLLVVTFITAGFLFIQFRYLFASEDIFRQMDISYSEYVHKGFNELLLATGIGGILTYILVLKQRELTESHLVRQLQILGTLFIVELWLLLASAFKRDLMYIAAYGITRVRLIGSWFLLWLFIMLCLLLVLNLRKQWHERWFLWGSGLVSAALLVYLNMVSIDAQIMAASPSHHQYPDYFYLANLSEETYREVPATVDQIAARVNQLTQQPQLSDVERSEFAGLKLAALSLHQRTRRIIQKYAPVEWQFDHYTTLYPAECDSCDTPSERLQQVKPEVITSEITWKRAGWRAWNHWESQAAADYQRNFQIYLTDLPTLIDEIKVYQIKTQQDLYTQERRLLYDFKYPFMNIAFEYPPHELVPFAEFNLRNERYRQMIERLFAANPPDQADTRQFYALASYFNSSNTGYDIKVWTTATSRPDTYSVLLLSNTNPKAAEYINRVRNKIALVKVTVNDTTITDLTELLVP